MRFARMGILAALVAVGVGCQSKVHDENVQLWQQNRELQARLASSVNEPKTDPAQVAQLQQQIAERDAKLAELQNQLRQPAPEQSPAAASDLQGIKTSYNKSTEKMTVAVPGDVLFNPGNATIRDEAKATLDKVASSLRRDYAAKSIRIEGHTDADPIRYSKWKSNEALSLARAQAVKAYLVKKGVHSSLITTVGLGADKARGADKAANRRVDIVVATR